jgi:hypothetical protein
MSAKDQILDFLALIFIIILISFCIIFFIAGDRFFVFTEIIKSLVPVAILAILFLIKYKLERREIKKEKEEGVLKIILYLDFFDKILSDLLVYLAPMGILLIALFFNKTVSFLDIIQALFILIFLYIWNYYLFTKDKE